MAKLAGCGHALVIVEATVVPSTRPKTATRFASSAVSAFQSVGGLAAGLQPSDRSDGRILGLRSRCSLDPRHSSDALSALRSSEGVGVGWPFSLTPALSRWERENHRPSFGEGRRGVGRRISRLANGIPGGSLSQRERIKVRENGPRSSAATFPPRQRLTTMKDAPL